MAKIDDYFQKLQNFLLRKLKIAQKVSGMKYTGSLGVYEMEFEAFRSIQVILGHPQTSNMGILFENTPFSYINDKMSKIHLIFDEPLKKFLS